MIIAAYGLTTSHAGGDEFYSGDWYEILRQAGYSDDQILQFSYSENYLSLLEQVQTGQVSIDDLDLKSLTQGWNAIDSTDPRFELDRRQIGDGKRRPITTELQAMYFDQIHGRRDSHPEWLTRVYD